MDKPVVYQKGWYRDDFAPLFLKGEVLFFRRKSKMANKYKDTLLIGTTDFSMRANLKDKEPLIEQD